MANIWERITTNSALPIAPGTTFFNHLMNQVPGTLQLFGAMEVKIMPDLVAKLEEDLNAKLEAEAVAQLGNTIIAEID